MSGVAGALPVRSGADDEDERTRRDQHAGTREASEGKDSSSVDFGGLWAIRSFTLRSRATGATSARSDRAHATTRASAAPRRCSWTTGDSTILRIKIVRIFNTYGPNMLPNDGRVVSNFIVQCLRGDDLTIYGEGSQTRSFCYVSDLIDGMIRMMNSPDDVTGPINLGNPEERTILQLAEEIKRLTESNSRIVFHELPKDDPIRRRPDIALATSLLGWSPNVGLDEGLGTTIEYFRRLLSENSA